MNRRLAILLLVAPLSSACASMSVKVDVYKHPLPASPAEVDPVAQFVVNDPRFDPEKIDQWYEHLAKVVYQRNEEALRKEVTDETVRRNSALRLAEGVKASLTTTHLTEQARQLRSAALAVLATHDVAAGPGPGFHEKVLAYDAAWEEACSKIETALPKVPVLYQCQIVAPSPTELRGIAASVKLDGPVLGVPLFDDRISLLDRSPERWIDFGRLNFKTSGGSSQFVVVREGLVVFHQKSLDFDPSTVIAAGSALTEAGLKIAAAVASGQVTKAATGQSDSAKGAQTATDRLVNEAEVEANRDLLARRVQARKEALLGLAQVFADLKKAEKGITDDQIKEFRTELQGQLDLYRTKSAKPEGSQ